MPGSPAIAGAVAHLAFWVLVARAWMERGLPLPLAFSGLWVAGYLGLPALGASLFFLPYVAVLDIALVLIVFKGDVRLLG